MDPLSHLLQMLDARADIYSRCEVGLATSLRFRGFSGIKFNAIVRGSCFVHPEGIDAPIWLNEGDCFLLGRGHPFVIGRDPQAPVVDGHALYRQHFDDGRMRIGDGSAFSVIGGHLEFDGSEADLLIAALPPVVAVSSRDPEAVTLRWLLEHFASELESDEPAAAAMALHLGNMMVMQMLRVWLRTQPGALTGWLGALRDARIAPALRLIHDAPQRHWTLVELAEACALSRSVFAERFRARTGLAPGDYLLRWRMRLAARDLRTTHKPVTLVAQEYGYASDSAFSNAFKRVMNASPRDYRRAQKDGVAPRETALLDAAQ